MLILTCLLQNFVLFFSCWQLAPGANVRLGEEGRIGKNVFIGLYSYINGDVVLEDDVMIGPHCSLTSNTHLFNTDNQNFRVRSHTIGLNLCLF